ncbi:MAG: hypothetical protein LBL66_07720 [Clostridiales bacterium]|jgi:hypothetical protein|nr:hypothetical protein [Clostridiales bacterium]
MAKKILYWKWDESIFSDGKAGRGLDDIVRRSDFDLIYLSFHHLGRPYDDPALYAELKAFADGLRAVGRGLVLDIDVRGELKGFSALCPGEEAQMIRFIEGDLDAGGNGAARVKNPSRGRTGRGATDKGPDKIAGAWAFDKADRGKSRGGPERIDASFSDGGGGVTDFRARGGAKNAGRRFLIAAAYSRGIPDHFSPELHAYYRKMLEYHKGLGLAGAANDEWGYDVFVEAADGNLYYAESFPYSAGLAAAYGRRFGRALDGDLFYFAYAPADDPGKSYGIIDGYTALLRARMRENNDWFYDNCKDVFGSDAFVGVHPTYWGDPYDFGFDVLQNGLGWWEAKRDFAQTDEFVLPPIRLALCHKWGGGVWYNMWYSGNTQQLHTYFAESWQNARFGGRTHYLGYECPNEPGVYNLKHPGALEQITAMERRIAELEPYQKSVPDSRVLVVFDIRAASNWLLSYGEARITRGMGTPPRILSWTAALFDRFLCDLIPSSEVENGSLRAENGVVAYGSQTYDAVIYLEADRAGTDFPALFGEYARRGRFFAFSGTYPPIADIVGRLDKAGVPRNRRRNGCKYRDGTWIFTSDGVLPRGNCLEIDEEIDGGRVREAGEDFIVLGKGGERIG